MASIKLSIVMDQFKPNYTKAELKLYEYIKDHLETVMYNSLTELSEICTVGEATILRFCRKIGYKGYQDFKLAVAQEHSLILSKPDGEDTFVNRIRNNMQKVIDDTHATMNPESIEAAIKWMDECEDIIIYGVGHSGITALDFQSRLMRVGKNVQVVSDPHFQVMRSCSANEKTLIIAISLTGSTMDIVDAVRIAKGKNAKIIAITSYVRSPLTRFADTVLLTSGKENPLDGGSMVGKVSQLFVIDLLCTGYIMNNMEYAQEIKKESAEAVTSKLY
jgi:DNA-binding MurR/RpiR family transcriptional regulator